MKTPAPPSPLPALRPHLCIAMRHSGVRILVWLVCGSGCALAAEAPQTLEDIEVIGVTPTHGVGLPADRIPNRVQTLTDVDLDRAQALDLADLLNRNLGSVTINDAQNNPLQLDIQFRGFTASPLLGLPQGIAVYQNAVRVNEVFGDTVNWDLIPESAIASINLIGGTSPLFGQNTLGGALSVRTKNGFTHPGHRAEASGGAFGRAQSSVESGANDGRFGYYANASYFAEEGWRDGSPSEALNFFGTASWHGDSTTLDLSVSHGDTELVGNGSLPVQLLARERDAVFTSPDITENHMEMVNLEAAHWLSELIQVSGNAFYRINDTDSFNGDGTEFEECAGTGPATGLLGNPHDFLCTEAGNAAEALVLSQRGDPLASGFDAINNLSSREQRSYGGALQTTLLLPVLGLDNQFIVGASYNQGSADFNSELEIARLLRDRSTSRTGVFVPDEATSARGRTRTWSIYLTDTVSLTSKLALTFSGRYNATRVRITDLSGDEPDLNGQHDFQRFNPAFGVTYQWRPSLGIYASYSESARGPTPVELSCADPDAPCNLPNSFLADPPLEQVVAKGFEGGLRGRIQGLLGLDLGATEWSLGGFHIINRDDILFQSTGGVSSNEGFFANVGDTRRLGVELGLNGEKGPISWFLNYSYVDARFQDPFLVSSPNHPSADDEGQTAVEDGDRIPSIPQHSVKVGAYVAVTPRLRLGSDLLYGSGQYLRGDEANLLDTIDGYATVNVRGEYRINQHLAVFAEVENLFDADYETFGLLGKPAEILGPGFDDPRFLGPGAPIAGWFGVKISL